MEIREAFPSEHGAIGDLAVRGYAEFYGEALGYYEERLRDVATRAAGGTVLVAVEDGEILGTVTYVPDHRSPLAERLRDGDASVRMLVVEPRHKRRGIGRALSIACIERARAAGKRGLVLHADEIMDASRGLYAGLGFRRDPDRDYRPDDETFLVCYALDLSES